MKTIALLLFASLAAVAIAGCVTDHTPGSPELYTSDVFHSPPHPGHGAGDPPAVEKHDPSCNAVGTGEEGSECCVFTEGFCDVGLWCRFLGDTAVGMCSPVNYQAPDTGQPCERTKNSCRPGDYCLYDPDANAGTGGSYCRTVCNPIDVPGESSCDSDAGETCVVVSDENSSVGACLVISTPP